MADNTGEAAAAVPAALPAAPETAAETAPKLARGSSGLPKGVGFVKKSRNYQGRVYDSLETKKQRGIGTFATPELAAAAVEVAEAQLKQGISPWLAPTRVNKHKRGEAPEPVAKKRVPSVVVSERDKLSRERPSRYQPPLKKCIMRALQHSLPSVRARICRCVLCLV